MGLLDDSFRNLAQTMVGLFTDTEATVLRRETAYDPATDLETVTETSSTFSVSPPLPLTLEQTQALNAGGNAIYGTECVVYAASADVEADNLSFTSLIEDKVAITVAGKSYIVLAVKEYRSGDQPALLEITLRG